MTSDAQAPEVTLFENLKNILFSKYANERERQDNYIRIRSAIPYHDPGHVLKAELEKDGSFLISSSISKTISHFLSYYRAAVFPHLSLENYDPTKPTYNCDHTYHPQPIYRHKQYFDDNESDDTSTPLKYPATFVKFSVYADDELMQLLVNPSHTQKSALQNFFDQCSKAEAREDYLQSLSLFNLDLPKPLRQFLGDYLHAQFPNPYQNTHWDNQAHSPATKVTPQSLVESLENFLEYEDLRDFSPAGDRGEEPYDLANAIFNDSLKKLADLDLENKAEDVKLEDSKTTSSGNYKVTVTLQKIKFEPGLKQKSFAEVRNGITQNANFYNKGVVCNGTIALEVSVRRQGT
ncbi:hypothetical protein P5705_19075 [Pseudomonas entomophila]|uniref:hypothetical protein n=1 Tax=Pseudomonas entomophila TaxID=312306 RepID=UPI0024052A29|nr:hypothetical protein [Pseudomonas entomophila]MDF9619755.1 hypothetical protein [Pseudomonas entomophila]